MIWKTRGGDEIDVRDMTDNHIRNALNMCKGRASALSSLADRACAYAMDAPDGAAMAAEQEADYAMDEAGKALIWVRIFKQELERRGILTRALR